MDPEVLITIYAPINFTAPCIMFSGWNFSLLGGLGPGTQDFFGARESNEKYQPENIMQGAVKFIGA